MKENFLFVLFNIKCPDDITLEHSQGYNGFFLANPNIIRIGAMLSAQFQGGRGGFPFPGGLQHPPFLPGAFKHDRDNDAGRR